MKVENLIKLFCNHENSKKIRELDLIKPLTNKTPNKFSGGEVRLLEVLLIIYSSAEFILLDEPFHSLSPKIISIVKDLIKEQSQCKGFIISDHLYQYVLDISDEAYLLSDSYLKPIKDLTELRRFNYLPKNI
jgi:lipopolysaccharide export system ATP-binding protein